MLYLTHNAIRWAGSGDADEILKIGQGKSFRKLDLLSAAKEETTRHLGMEDEWER
jgi:hypothetical protein